MNEIVNKVANSGLLTIDLEELYDSSEKQSIDMKDYLFQGLILKEKDFRMAVKEQNWEDYKGKNVAVYCSVDAIVPTWAYMLIVNRLEPHANKVFFCEEKDLDERILQEKIETLDLSSYADQRVVVKGCSDIQIPIATYALITKKLTPIVKSIFYGEPCSTVPIYKKKVNR